VNSEAASYGPADETLVGRARDGDMDAFATLVGRYQTRVYNAAYRICRNRADAADIAQSVFLKALEALPRYQEQAAFHSWLFRIAVNTALTVLRRRSQLPRATSSRDGQTLGDVPERRPRVVEAEIDDREMHDRVAAALERLEPEYRAAIVLRDVEGMDYATIGSVLGLPVGTVKSRIHRGRMLLRAQLLGNATHAPEMEADEHRSRPQIR
jgi:RNA polymerase sigma-70 factor (ECF subfamily)